MLDGAAWEHISSATHVLPYASTWFADLCWCFPALDADSCSAILLTFSALSVSCLHHTCVCLAAEAGMHVQQAAKLPGLL